MSHVYFLMFSVTIYTLDVTFKYPPQNNLVAVVVVVVFIKDIIITIIVNIYTMYIRFDYILV